MPYLTEKFPNICKFIINDIAQSRPLTVGVSLGDFKHHLFKENFFKQIFDWRGTKMKELYSNRRLDAWESIILDFVE